MASRDLRINFIADTRGYNRAMVSGSANTDKFASRIDKWKGTAATAFKVGGAAAGIFAVKLGVDSVKAAIEAEKSQARMVTQLKASGVSWKRHGDEIDRVIQKHSTLSGLDDEDLQDAFTNIVRVTGNVTKSLNLTGLAADFARAKHMDVAKAGELVGKVAGGNTGILGRYGIKIKEGATATEALGELQKKFKGQAEAYGKTTQGSVDRLGVAWENVQEKLGKKLLPILVDVSKWLLRMINNWEKSRGTMGNIRRAIEDTATAIGDMIQWIKNAIRNVNAWGDSVRRGLVGAWRTMERVFGNVLAKVLRGIGDVLDVMGKFPGKVGEPFRDAARAAHSAADRVDQLGENIDDLPSKKSVKVQVDLLMKDFLAGDVPKLQKLPHGGPGLLDKVKSGAKKRGKQWALDHLDEIAPLLGAPGNLSGGLSLIQKISLAMGLSGGLGSGQGYRPGDRGWHGRGRALDNSGPAGQMMKFARRMFEDFGARLKELIYSPMGVGIKNGRPVNILDFYGSSVYADHFDHVHVALQRGGLIPGVGTGDKVPVLAEPGEGFINRRAVAALGGAEAIAAINRMVPRFQGGGTVPDEYVRLIGIASKRTGVPARILAGLIDVESGFDPNAVSPAGAFGLTQFMPGTATGYGVRRGSSHGAVASQIIGAARYLIALGFKSDPRGALAKYNGGPGNPQYGYADDVLRTAQRYAGIDPGGGGGGFRGKKDMDPTRRGYQRLTPAERRERTPVHGGTGLSLEERGDIVTRMEGRAETTPGTRDDTRAHLSRLGLLVEERRRLRRRLHTINRALKGKLKPATRKRLEGERAGILSRLGAIPGEATSALEALQAIPGTGGWLKPFARELGVGVPVPEAADTGGGAADDGAQQLADEIKALREAITEQNRIFQSSAAIQARELQKALGDLVSGQLGAVTGQRGRAAGDGVTGARY